MAEEPPTFDLQSHSHHSDGELAPSAVVERADAAGVQLLALTDHDSVDGVPEAAEAAGALPLRLVTGVEISALDRDHGDLHILGYLVDDRDSELRALLQEFRADRVRRAEAMAQALRDLGLALDEESLRARVEQGKSVGRPHLAQAVVGHPANRERLIDEGRAEPSAFLEGYLVEGAPAFRPRRAPTVEQAIAAIHDAGGVAVWAHPFWDVTAPAEVLDAVARFVALGLDGVECFYATHTRAQTDTLVAACTERGLLTTGSADFHGPHHRQFSRFRAFSTFGHEPRLGPLLG